MTNLRDKLQALGFSNEKPIDNQIQNKLIKENAHSNGQIYKITETFPIPFLHGDLLFDQNVPLDIIGEWIKSTDLSLLNVKDAIFIDTETTGLSGGTGTFAFMIGAGLYREDHFEVHQYFLPDPDDEDIFLDEIRQLLQPFSILVTFNGKSFDLPLLQTRFILNQIQINLEEKTHIDLLHLARRIWKARLESCSLSELEKQILHVIRERDEVPGYLIPETYFNYLKSKEFSVMDGVFYHNRIDILSLAALFQLVGKTISQPGCYPLNTIDRASIAKLHHDLGHWEIASELYSQSISEEMPQTLLINALMRNAEIFKKQGKILEAIELWERAAKNGSLEAHLELAKVFEHTIKNYHDALEWANKAFNLCSTLPLPLWKRREWLREISHRIERLEQKIARKDRTHGD